jgi:hypothetical protein
MSPETLANLKQVSSEIKELISEGLAVQSKLKTLTERSTPPITHFTPLPSTAKNRTQTGYEYHSIPSKLP